MGKTTKRERTFGKEALKPETQKDRSRKTESLFEGTSRRIPERDSGGVWLYGLRNTQSVEATGHYAKKKTTRYREQTPEAVSAYLEQIADIPPEKIVYIDETGIDTFLYREYGYAPRGQRVYGHISGHKYKRIGIVAGLMNNRIVAPLEYEGTMDSALFEKWFLQHLLPAVGADAAIVMDNASFHRKKQLISAAQNSGCKLIFLPPYSPELNPIENFWSWLKRYLRKILPSVPSFDDALFDAFQVV